MHKSYWVDFNEIWFKDGKKGHEETKMNIIGANLLASDIKIPEIGQLLLENKKNTKTNTKKWGFSLL